MDLSSLDISVLPHTKVCPRYWYEIVEKLNNPKEYE